MVAIAHNAKLNDLAIDLGRNLLQYAADVGVWAAHAIDEHRLQDAAASQRDDVGKLVELLQTRGWAVDPGTYPTEFTDLQFLSLTYILPRILDEQRALVEDLDEAVHTCIDDPEAVALLRDIAANERRIAEDLAQLAAPAASAAAR
jgi:hypothetical protein